MTEQKSKISFGPARKDSVHRISVSQDTGTSAPAQEATGQPTQSDQSRPVRKVVRVSTPVTKPVPVAPGFASTGLMAVSEASFVRRNSTLVGIAVIVGITLFMGLSSGYIMLGDDAGRARAASLATTPQTAFSTPSRPEITAVIETATRAASPDFTNIVGPIDLPTVDESSATVLAAVTPEVVAPLQFLSATKLRILREGVLADLYQAEVIDVGGVQRVTLEVRNAKFASALPDEVILAASNDGRIETGPSFRTPDGGLDTHTMVFDIVQRSLFDDQNLTSIRAAQNMSRKVFAASMARTQDVGGQRMYTVQTGDSLAYISLQFYGVPSAYTRILEANRDTLQSPDKIQVGQRLIIPS